MISICEFVIGFANGFLHLLFRVRSPQGESSKEGWLFSKTFRTNLQLGEPEINFNITTIPTPRSQQLIRCKVPGFYFS